MGRAANLSPLGLYEWDSTIFDLMQIPEALDKKTIVEWILAETCELEVLYPNPIVFKNLVGVWSRKQLDIWNRLYETTQYEYNPIENYNRYETGSEDGTGRTTHSGTDRTTDTTTYGGTDGRTEAIRHGGTDTEGFTGSVEQGGTDSTLANDKKGHWVAGYNPNTPTPPDDGLLKQTRDEDEADSSTTYGKTEDSESQRTTRFGKTENVSEQRTYGQTIDKSGSMTHGEEVATTNEGTHELHAHGNIGVTTTQKLIREQRDIELFNLYDIIKEDFKMRFCILVY